MPSTVAHSMGSVELACSPSKIPCSIDLDLALILWSVSRKWNAGLACGLQESSHKWKLEISKGGSLDCVKSICNHTTVKKKRGESLTVPMLFYTKAKVLLIYIYRRVNLRLFAEPAWRKFREVFWYCHFLACWFSPLVHFLLFTVFLLFYLPIWTLSV